MCWMLPRRPSLPFQFPAYCVLHRLYLFKLLKLEEEEEANRPSSLEHMCHQVRVCVHHARIYMTLQYVALFLRSAPHNQVQRRTTGKSRPPRLTSTSPEHCWSWRTSGLLDLIIIYLVLIWHQNLITHLQAFFFIFYNFSSSHDIMIIAWFIYILGSINCVWWI